MSRSPRTAEPCISNRLHNVGRHIFFLKWKVSGSDVHATPLPAQQFWRFATTGRCTEPITSFRCLAVDGETKPGSPLREAPCSSSIIFDLDHEALELLSSVHSHESSFLPFTTSLTVNYISRRPNCTGTFQCRSINEHAILRDRSSDESGRVRTAHGASPWSLFCCLRFSVAGWCEEAPDGGDFMVLVASYLPTRVQITAPICAAGPVALLAPGRRISASVISRLARGVW